MDASGGRLSFQHCGGERRADIPSGGGGCYHSSSHQMYTASRPQSLDPPPVPPEAAQAAANPWGFSDPVTKRRKRIARYKVYAVEGRVKASIRKKLRWIKNKCSQIIHGY